MSGLPTENRLGRKLRSTSTSSSSASPNPSVKTSAKKSVPTKKSTTKKTNPTSTPTATTITNKSDNIETTIKTQKRKTISSPSSPEIIHTAKKPTHTMANEPLTADSMRNLFVEFTREIQTNLSQTIESTVQREVHSLGEQLKLDFRNQLTDINNKIDEYKQSFDLKLDEMKSMVDSCSDRVNVGEDDIHRITKLCELKIKGIPYTQGEKLHDLFTLIAQHVGFDLTTPNHVPVLNRIQSKKKDTNEPSQLPIIIVKFVAKHIRDSFYSLYLSKIAITPLKTEHVKMTAGNRIIICENLTASNQKLFNAAMQLKIDKKLVKVFTKDGLVLVKKADDSKAKIIRISRDLDSYSTGTSSSSNSSTSNNNNSNANMMTDAAKGLTTPVPMQTDK